MSTIPVLKLSMLDGDPDKKKNYIFVEGSGS